MKISRARTFKAALVLLLAGALTNFFLAPVRAALPDTVHLTIHYQRTNADYTDWNVYLWKDLPGSANDKEVSAAGFPFQSEDSFGKIAKIDVTGTAAFDQIGIIIRRGAWAEKEGSLDRFITTFDSNGNAEVWIRQGDVTIYPALPTTAIPTNPAVEQARIFDSPDFAAKYTYTGNDLGNTYSTKETKFRVWAPTASKVSLLTFATLNSNDATEKPMTSDVNGTWITTMPGDLNGVSYQYRVTVDGNTNDAVDPYVRATTVNGTKGRSRRSLKDKSGWLEFHEAKVLR